MKNRFDVVVIGGGIIGCSIAYYLAKEKLNVAVMESQQIGSKATGAAAGMLGAHSECNDLEIFYPFARESQKTYAQVQEEIKELSGIDIELREGGLLKLAYTESEKRSLNEILTLPTVKWYSAEDVKKEIPTVSPTIIGAAYIEDDVTVLPTSVYHGFSRSAQLLGTSLFEYTTVTGIQKNGSSYLINTTKGSFEANYIVVANGVWSSSFFKELGLEHQLTPIKGECLSVYSENISLKHTLFHDHSCIVPRNNGRLVIGATQVVNEWNEKPNLNGIEALIAKAKTMLPAVADMKLESFWAGLRPQTADQRPFIGPHPNDENILFATGHYRNGILLAPATAKMIRDFILKKEIRKDWVEAFKINRTCETSISSFTTR